MNYSESEYKYYTDKYKSHGDSKDSLGYYNALGQVSRFRAVCDALRAVPVRSVLDVGCGHGDFYPYAAAEFDLQEFVGVDIVSDFISICQKSHSDSVARWEAGTVFDCEAKFDAVVAMGAFTLKDDDADHVWRSTVKRMFDLSKFACVFTVLTKTEPREHEWTTTLSEIVSFAESLSEKVFIDRRTLPYSAVCGIYR